MFFKKVGNFISSPFKRAANAYRVASGFTMLYELPEMQDLQQIMRQNNIRLGMSKDVPGACFSGTYKPENGNWKLQGKSWIFTNPEADKDLACGFFAHEWRHARQAIEGVLYVNKQLSPLDFVKYHLMIEADAQAEAIVMLMRLKIAGNPKPWERMQASEYWKMFTIAEMIYNSDPTSLDNGHMKRNAFHAFFSTEALVESYANRAIDLLWPSIQQLLQDNPGHGMVRAPLTAADIEKLGTIGGAKINYLTLDTKYLPLDHAWYLNHLSEATAAKLAEMTTAWEKSGKIPEHPTPAAPKI